MNKSNDGKETNLRIDESSNILVKSVRSCILIHMGLSVFELSK